MPVYSPTEPRGSRLTPMANSVRTFGAFFLITNAALISGANAAQPYPTKPLRIIVAGAAGGSPDIAARQVVNELIPQMGQQVVVDNRPGASGIIGWEILARAAPDGYTMGYISNQFSTNPSLFPKLPYDNDKDFQPIVLLHSAPTVLAVNPALPIRSVKELIDEARAKPGTLSFGSIGIGSAQHLSMELLKSATGTHMVHVPYKGSPQALTELIAGQIQVMCDAIAPILPHVRSGRVRALGVSSLKRSLSLPEVPTIDEAGVAGYELTAWSGYAFPARTPRELVLRMNSEMNKALLSPTLAKAITARGATAVGSTPEQFTEHLRRETAKWGKIIKAASIKPQ